MKRQWVALTQASRRQPVMMLGSGTSKERVEATARQVIQSFQPRLSGGWLIRTLVKFDVDHALHHLQVLPAEEAKKRYPDVWRRYWKHQEQLR